MDRFASSVEAVGGVQMEDSHQLAMVNIGIEFTAATRLSLNGILGKED